MLKIKQLHENQGQIQIRCNDNLCILLPDQGNKTREILEALIEIAKKEISFNSVKVSSSKIMLVDTSFGRDIYLNLYAKNDNLEGVKEIFNKIFKFPPTTNNHWEKPL